MVERSLSMREALGSMPRFSTFLVPRNRILFADVIRLGRRVCIPNIAQLVERSTVDEAGIEWSLVRFRVFGVFRHISPLLFFKSHWRCAKVAQVLWCNG